MDKGRGKKWPQRDQEYLWHCLMRKYWLLLYYSFNPEQTECLCSFFFGLCFEGGPSRRWRHDRWVLVYAVPYPSVTDGRYSKRRTKGMWEMLPFCKQHVLHAFLLCLCRCSPSLLTEQHFSQQNVSINLYLHCCCGSCIPHKIALMVKLNFWPAIQLASHWCSELTAGTIQRVLGSLQHRCWLKTTECR